MIEDRFNREAAERGLARRIEILNFSVSGYGPISAMARLEQRAFVFDPDMILYISLDDVPWIANEVANSVEKKLSIPYREVLDVEAAAGIEPGLPQIVAEQKLQGKREELLLWVYRRMVALGQKHGIPVAASFIPPAPRSSRTARTCWFARSRSRARLA